MPANPASRAKTLFHRRLPAGIARPSEALEKARLEPGQQAAGFRLHVGIMTSEQLHWPEIGGGFTFEHEIVQALLRLRTESRHRYTFLGYSPEKPPILAGTEIPWVNACFPPAPPEQPIFDFDLCPEVKHASLDLICYLNPWTSPFLDIPFILNVWDLAHRICPFFPEVSLAGTWNARELHFQQRIQRATYVITPNATGKREIANFYRVPEEKVRELHHPTPSFVLRAGERRAEKKPLDHLGVKGEFLFYPAQFWSHKNHVLLLRVLVALKRKYGYAPQLVFTGSDKPLFDSARIGNKAFIEQGAVELSLQKQVIFAGFVSQEDLIALYQQAIALVFPSFFGPENIPPLEAFALGCPVIASRIHGSEDQMGDAALLVDPTDPEAWAEAVYKVRQKARWRSSLIAKGKKRARRFTPDHFARGLFQMIDEFAGYRCNWPTSF
jgi:glycosyltransferase involved in cell wall biosynthesis